jgi:hypothetical protein
MYLVRELVVDFRRRQLDEKCGEAIDEDFEHLVGFVWVGGVGIAGAGVGGEEVPGASDADPTAIDGVEAGFGSFAVVGSELAVSRPGDEVWVEGHDERRFHFAGVIVRMLKDLASGFVIEDVVPVA